MEVTFAQAAAEHDMPRGGEDNGILYGRIRGFATSFNGLMTHAKMVELSGYRSDRRDLQKAAAHSLIT